MRKKSKILSLGLAIVLGVTMTCSVSFADVKSEKDKLSDLNDQKNQAAEKQKKLENSKAEAEAYINSVDKKLTNLATEIYETDQKLDKTKDKINKTNKKLKSAEESVKTQYSDMKLRIQYMYENGDSQMLDLILNSGSITEFLNKAEYITELSQYDRKMLQKFKDTQQEIKEAKTTLETEQKNLVAMQKQQKSDKAELEALSDSKKQDLASYMAQLRDNEENAKAIESQISAQEQRVASAEQESINDAKAAAAAAEAAKKAAEAKKAQENTTKAPSSNGGNTGNAGNSGNTGGQTSPPAGGGNGTFSWPCPGHTYVSSGFGYRSDPFSGKTSYHSGIDIPASTGTPVVAAGSGRVEWSEPNPTAGNWIGINHGNGVYTIYMHMSALLVGAGTNVSAGQTIGLVGNTGSSTASHLHFTVRVNGSYVNPYNYLK